MSRYEQVATFLSLPTLRPAESVDQKIAASRELLARIASKELIDGITADQYINGEVPRLTEFDLPHLPDETRLVELPESMVEEMHRVRNLDIAAWNMPAAFLGRLRTGREPFVKPTRGESPAMERLTRENRIVSFSNLNIESREPDGDRHSRTSVYEDMVRGYNIMGRGRIPFGLGSMPDVGSVLGYMTAAQSNAMVFVARDKVLSDTGKQVEVTRRVIDSLQGIEIPEYMLPDELQLKEFWKIMGYGSEEYNRLLASKRYQQALRDSWAANVGAAIEASPVKGLERAKRLQDAGCRMLRIYSPEGGLETVQQTERLRGSFADDPDLTVVTGQMMHLSTAKAAAEAGADGLIIGVAGGSQCTTSENSGIPVNTPHLLYEMRGELEIPIGVEGGGVGGHLMEAFALGASFLLKPGEIGRSLEGAGGKYILEDARRRQYILYGGEAADSSKYWRDLVDELGRPTFPEGESGVRELTSDRLYMTTNIRGLLQQLSIALVFQRAQDVSEVHKRDCSNIAEVSPEVKGLSGAYGQ